ncbi:MAG TPA: methyltransferase domain-containing protein [Candidatus Limnocylindrales bacterium]|nr:methyltransferase domain-containing protein [Candidatus Limnocylindrales bacterium]
MRDRWAQWLLDRRFGGDPVSRERMLPGLMEYRDRVLAGAAIRAGDVVLDVGCGDGLLAVGALETDAAKVIFSDVSEDLLRRCRDTIDDPRAEFVHTGLPELEAIAPESVDVAMTRSVLIYVADKASSFVSLRRVLRPGGRLSIFEPINRFCDPGRPQQLWGYDITGLEELGAKANAAADRHTAAVNGPMVDFDERDLLALAQGAGFSEVKLDYSAEIALRRHEIRWEEWLRHAPNPLVPTLGEILAEALTPAEREALAEHIEARRAAPDGMAVSRSAVAYLTARA